MSENIFPPDGQAVPLACSAHLAYQITDHALGLMRKAGWCQNADAKNKGRAAVSFDDPNAKFLCLQGAINRAADWYIGFGKLRVHEQRGRAGTAISTGLYIGQLHHDHYGELPCAFNDQNKMSKRAVLKRLEEFIHHLADRRET